MLLLQILIPLYFLSFCIQNFSIINLLIIPTSFWGASLLSAVFMKELYEGKSQHFRLISLFMGFSILLGCIYSSIYQNYVFGFIALGVSIFPIVFDRGSIGDAKTASVNYLINSKSFADDLWEYYKDKKDIGYKMDLEYTFQSEKSDTEIASILLNFLNSILKDKGYQFIVDFENKKKEKEGFYEMFEGGQIGYYFLMIGGAQQEIGNLNEANEYFDKYLSLLDIQENNLPDEWELGVSEYKLFLLMGELKEWGIAYQLETEKGEISIV